MILFHELAPSPNSTKLRMALRYKGLDFEAVQVDPFERSGLVAASGQELTPVIEDRGIVLNDSEAILHYLDANYRDAPRLFPGDRAGRYAADGFKTRIESEVGPHWAAVFFYAIKRRETLDEDAASRYREALARFDEELASRGSYADEAGAVSDLRVAQWATYALPGPGLLQRVPLFGKLRELYGVEPGSLPHVEKLIAPWNERLA